MKRNSVLELGVGVFMLAGILGLVFLGLRVSGLGVSGPSDTYTLTANFANIGGLRPQAKVTMSGVRVGKVTDISLDPQWFDARVTMEIDDAYEGKLSGDTTAAILTSGLLGEQYIGLTVGGSPDMLEDGDVIHDTQQALVLEELIQQFVSNMAN
ncbi:outer membrane lipid asymmetry maintenance protein MlaD [Salinicola avicenniae]|uniref:outer membrane lipid asymmetry maintenance protein MlaD n=1 Tax=Salinicola avicenniae TaxID=2916836 RepID=UPI002073E842|nr:MULTISPECIES: outer membrane lipid asymmetry maintenance protein MlaD [unclassified Salinicola]